MDPAIFEIYRKLLETESGLVLKPDKSYLLESRLRNIAEKHGISDLRAMSEKLTPSRSGAYRELVNDVVDAMTTNETSFFRDSRPFALLTDTVMPALMQARPGRKIRIWSAACSSGQEPYSIITALEESRNKLGVRDWPFEIIATDISRDILQQAQDALYSQFEIQRGLPTTMLVKYFVQEGDKWRFKPEYRNRVQFKQLNLLKDFSHLGNFDIIFCRNVLIYFDQNVKADILNRLNQRLPSDGYLFLGGSETVFGITDLFKPLPEARGVYIKPESAKSEDRSSQS